VGYIIIALPEIYRCLWCKNFENRLAFGKKFEARAVFPNRVYITVVENCSVLFCSLAFLDPRVGHTMDVLSPFISILCHSD